MNRAVLACAALGLLGCNTAPKPTCNTVTNSLISAGTPPASGVLITLPSAADASFEICATDCTDGGQAECTEGTTCVSAAPLLPQKAVCVLTCGSDDAGTDAGTCPSPLACSDAGLCTCLADGGCL